MNGFHMWFKGVPVYGTETKATIGFPPGELGRFPRPKPTLHDRRRRVAMWLAWKRVGPPVDESGDSGYVGLGPVTTCVDGYYTPAELRRIAAATEEFARIIAGWYGDTA